MNVVYFPSLRVIPYRLRLLGAILSLDSHFDHLPEGLLHIVPSLGTHFKVENARTASCFKLLIPGESGFFQLLLGLGGCVFAPLLGLDRLDLALGGVVHFVSHEDEGETPG